MLKLYNSMSRTKEVFRPRSKDEVRIFTCGPSIYKRPHIGNYRTFLYEDVLIKYLEYSGARVKRVINFTDVEDKSIKEARELNKNVSEVVGDCSKFFFSETELLKIKLPKQIPASSTCVDTAVNLIKILLKKGIAYEFKGSIFFDPLKFEDFGKLFHLDMTRWPTEKKRFWKDNYDGNHWHRGDFILWHGYKKGANPFWDTEIGRGRPSWHIQDPAIIYEHLGSTIDINCGGIDNIYRHHDYNIAIMESVTGKKFAHYYLHGEHLKVDGKTMSKSTGNVLYPDDVIGGNIEPEHLRFFLTYSPYRNKLNFTQNAFSKSVKYLNSIRDAMQILSNITGEGEISDGKKDSLIKQIRIVFEEKLDDNLNVKDAVDSIYDILRRLLILKGKGLLSRKDSEMIKSRLMEIDTVFGFLF